MPLGSYARLHQASVVDAAERDERHPLLRIATRLIRDGILRDANPLRYIRERDERGSPAGRRHNEVIEKVIDASVLNCYRRSIEEPDFETKSRWTDVFRKLEDGPGVNKKTMKYHCAIKDRAQVKEYYRQLVYIRLKTWVHAAVCRAVAPFVPELREYRCFSFSGERKLQNPDEAVKAMTKTSENGAPFETWCKADIQGTRHYRSAEEKEEHLRNNKSLYVVRYVGPSYGLDVSPHSSAEACALLRRMAGTFPGYCLTDNENLAEVITSEFVGKMPRRRWGELFRDSEWFWGHGRVMSFPIQLGKAIPTDPAKIFCPDPKPEAHPVVDRTPAHYVYTYDTALDLITSVDCLREIVTVGGLGVIKSTPAERTFVQNALFTPEIINKNTEREAQRVMLKMERLHMTALRNKAKKRLRGYQDLVKSDSTQWRFFVRLVQLLKLKENSTLSELYKQ